MRTLALLALVSGSLACGGVTNANDDASNSDGATGSDGGNTADAAPAARPVAPVAPSVGTAMYQGSQLLFTTDTGGTCSGRVAASMADDGFCFLAADDNVKCAGVVGGVDYGMVPSNAGVTGARQIMVFFNDNGMCVTKTDDTVECMGTNTNAFGNAITQQFNRWTARTDLVAIASGTWDQICGITTNGQVYCGSSLNGSYGIPPVAVGAAGQSSLWVNTFGDAQLSDTTVLRAGTSRTVCQVRAGGLQCSGMTYGPSDGTIVSGHIISNGGIDPDTICWLDTAGTVTCDTGPRFDAGRVLLLATDFYTDSMCAIYDDGSIWCMGSNNNGKFGTGNTAPLATEAMVLPPGTARVACD